MARTNIHFTLKENPLKRTDLGEFVSCFHPENGHDRKPTWSEENPQGLKRAFNYEELLKRDKVNPDIIAAEIVEDLEAALEQFALIAEDLKR